MFQGEHVESSQVKSPRGDQVAFSDQPQESCSVALPPSIGYKQVTKGSPDQGEGKKLLDVREWQHHIGKEHMGRNTTWPSLKSVPTECRTNPSLPTAEIKTLRCVQRITLKADVHAA